MPSTIYQPLDVNRREIRLIELAAGNSKDALTAEFLIVSFDDTPVPRYETLSYTWGETPTRGEIEVCSTTLSITTNLEAALVRMRLPDCARTLWADAICINQDDTTERENQVQIMGTIYSQCIRVLIWLGPEEPGDFQAWEMINSSTKGEQITVDCLFNDGSIEITRKCGSAIQELAALTHRAWWSRLWTLQEVVLAPEVLIHVGKLEIQWSQLVQTHNAMIKEGLPNTSSVPRISCGKCLAARDTLFPKVQFIAALREHRVPRVDIMKVIVSNRSRQATDPRDRIYGVMGLSDLTYRPDYSVSVEWAYTKFAWYDIQKKNDLRVLVFALDNDRGTLNLPSWVPDWSCSSRRSETVELTQLNIYNQYNACGSCQFAGMGSRHNSSAPSALALDGFHVDTVCKVGEIFPLGDLVVHWAVVKSWYKLSGVESDPTGLYPGGTEAREAFWRTVLADIIMDLSSTLEGGELLHPIPPDYKEWFWKVWERNMLPDVAECDGFVALGINAFTGIVEDMDVMRICIGILSSFSLVTQGRRFFVSETGLFGTSQHGVMEGDEIWIAQGGKMPMILRRAPQEDRLRSELADVGKQDKIYSLTGLGYVHGVMDGELSPKFDGRDKEQIFLI